MKQILDQNPQVVAYAAEAINRAGLDVTTESIRGGTDGSRLVLWDCLVLIFLQACSAFIQSWSGLV